jgi:hypothetical protein
MFKRKAAWEHPGDTRGSKMDRRKYTNQTFTKRVDHEGGTHRPPKKLKGPVRCTKCGSVYTSGHWISKNAAAGRPELRKEMVGGSAPCPACVQIENDIVGGYLTLSGTFPMQHRPEIDLLLKHEAHDALEDNPLSRVMRVHESEGTVVIETTTEHLAQRLGHSLKKAYSGEVKYQFSHENKVARVSWHRD